MEVTGAVAPAPRRGRRPLLLAALLVVLSGAASRYGAAEDAAPSAPAPAADAAARVLRVGSTGDYPPFSRSTAQGMEGFDLDVAAAFASERGYRMELVPLRWPELKQALADGRFDVAMGGVTVKAERSIAGRFSIPVAATHALAMSWKGSGVTTLGELDKPTRRVAVNAGGHLETVARANLHRAVVVAMPDNEAVRMAAMDRAFDAVVTDSVEAGIWSDGRSDVVRIEPLSDDRKAYLLPADRVDLAAELDAWLFAREKDGTLARLREKWFAASGSPGSGPQQPTATPIAALAAAIAERQSLMPLVYDAKLREQRPIEDKAQEAAVLDAALAAVADAARAANRPAPDTEAMRSFFAVLMDAGKDAQQALADRDARRRPGVVLHRSSEGGEPKEKEHAPARRPGPVKPAFDLQSELRPALSRVTAKIARILVAMDEPVGVSDAHRVLSATLEPADLRRERIEAVADAVVRISRGR